MSVGTSLKKRPLFKIELRRCLINYKSGGREKKQLFWRSPGMVLSTMSIQAVRRMLLVIGDDDGAAELRLMMSITGFTGSPLTTRAQ